MLIIVMVMQALVLAMLIYQMINNKVTRFTQNDRKEELPCADLAAKHSVGRMDKIEMGDIVKAIRQENKDAEAKAVTTIAQSISETSNKDTIHLYQSIEKALTMYPSNKKLFTQAYDLIKKELVGGNLTTRRGLINRLTEYTNRFYNYCIWDDLSFALEKKQEVSLLVDKLVSELDNRKQKHIEESLSRMEGLVVKLGKSSTASRPKMLEEISAIDESISKNDLKLYNLDDRYKAVFSKLTEDLQKGSDVDRIDTKYNQRAIDSASKAAEEFTKHKAEGFFTDNENDYNRPEKLKKLISHLSGWDTTKLTYYTNMYVTSVYSEIFSKLKPESRPIITQMMLESEKK